MSKEVYKKGFTLVELLVVIVILAILAVVGMTSFGKVTANARDGKRRGDVDAISKAFEASYDAQRGVYRTLTAADFTNGAIPTTPEGGSYQLATITSGSSGTYKGYRVCVQLESHPAGTACTRTSSTCYCRDSALGVQVADSSIPPFSDLTPTTPTPTTTPTTTSPTPASVFTPTPAPVSPPTPAPTPIPTSPPAPAAFVCTACAADIDGNGTVNNTDWGTWRQCQRSPSTCSNPKADINGDGSFNQADEDCWRSQIGQTCTTSTPTPPPFVCTACAADVNGDGRVSSSDVSMVTICFNKPASQCSNPRADINGDGTVNQPDADCARSQFGQTCSR